MKRRAVFFDRDKTLIEDPGFINQPDQVRLFDDVPGAIARLRRAGFCIVVITNQSGVARGLITEEQLEAVHQRLQDLLAERGAPLDAIYSCPYLDGPEATVERYRRQSHLRKPDPGMLIEAAEDLKLDLRRSWIVGDRGRDIEAGRRAGCRTILLERAARDTVERDARPTHTAGSLDEAADLILREDASASPGVAAASAGGESPGSLRPVLLEIRDLLDRSTRRQRQEDFSLVRLCAALLQMLAFVVAAWGVLALLSREDGAATARFTLAVFLQLATLALAWSGPRQ